MHDSALSEPTCPSCGHTPAWTRCWECDWEKPREESPKPKGESPKLPDDRSEKQIEAGILKTLRKLLWTVYKMSQPRATMVSEGPADLFVCGYGANGWLEVKTQKGSQSDAQLWFERDVTENGGRYAVVRSEHEAVEVVEAWRADVKREVA